MSRIKKQLEIFEDIQERIEFDGIEHAFEFSWEEIDDPIFHKKRKDYLKSVEVLKEYVDYQCKLLNSVKDLKL
ncbi:MAG: hypothetical protein RL348_1127 [Bacteroidota bacterium]|jgi:hypothetical protein